MKLALSSMISEIDKYATEKLGIPVTDLMKKSGEAVVKVVYDRVARGGHVVILAGKGNNGGDGYAAAVSLLDDYDVTVYDIFSEGQKNEAGKHFLNEYISRGGRVINFSPTDKIKADIKNADCIIDAVFGTGFQGEMPEEIRPLAITVREAVQAKKIAIDVPLGINADNGSVSDFAISVGATVELSFIKPGIISYPARSFVGKVVYDDLGLPRSEIASRFDFKYHMIDEEWVRSNLPKREENSNKGSFGKLLMITGSERYRGAAHLSLEAALRGGVGLVTYVGTKSLISELSSKYPEVIYKQRSKYENLTDEEIEELIRLSNKHTATLIGSGSDNTEGLLRIVAKFLSTEGTPLIIDADAINVLADNKLLDLIKNSKRKVIMTPHPLEFARISQNDVAAVQLHRLEVSTKFAKENSCTLVLKGAGTIITDGEETYINVAGSSALAKAGSGDVLAGFLSALIAQGKCEILKSASLGVYYHAMAADVLSEEFSSYGVIPSDLPREIARQIAKTEFSK